MFEVDVASHTLKFLDILIFVSVLVFSLGIGKIAIFCLVPVKLHKSNCNCLGLYHAFTGGKQKTLSEYYTGDRNLRTLPVALSILVSFVSAILVLGTPAEMYTRYVVMFSTSS